MPGLHRDAEELRAVAPLVAVVGDSHELVGAVTLVAHAGKTLGVTSAELIRPHATAKLRVLTSLDGTSHVDVLGIGIGRYAGLGLLELAQPIPAAAGVKPLALDHVCATNDTRGAPACIVVIRPTATGLERLLVPVHVDVDDGGGMAEAATRLATAQDAAHATLEIEGCPVFAAFPPNPALRRAGEVLVVAIAYPYTAAIIQPRPLPVLAEIIALDDLGRALISSHDHDERDELPQVAGEIVDAASPDPLAGFDDERDSGLGT